MSKIIDSVRISFLKQEGEFCYFRLSEKTSVHSDWFIMTVKESTLTYFIFRKCGETPSCPQLILAMMSSIYFCTKAESTHSNSMEHAKRCFRYE